MRAVVSRVTQASVTVGGEQVAAITGPGVLALVGVTHGDDIATAEALAAKIYHLRILDGEQSCAATGAPMLIVSQFTLYGDARRGRRPSWTAAAPAAVAEPLLDHLVMTLRDSGADVRAGRFGSHMRVTSTNDGPMTVLVEM